MSSLSRLKYLRQEVVDTQHGSAFLGISGFASPVLPTRRGSTSECGAVLDAALTTKIGDKEKTLQGKNLLVEIARMLSKML